jgi:hypothetical protein
MQHEEFLQFGSAAMNPDLRPPGMLIGESLHWAMHMLRFGMELVQRQRVLPGIEQEDAEWKARWHPVIDATDRTRIRGHPALILP